MARPLRVEYPGAFYHVINRGNTGQDLFKSLRDREKFLEYLETATTRFLIRIHTYCLMTNHYHLLVETPEANLSRAMQWINVSYAVYFNTKRERHGHLFQGRFKSVLVEADEYLKPLSRYIHLNPVRAKMIGSASDYPWSSYSFFIGKKKAPKWLESDWLLSQFGGNQRGSHKNYQAYVEDVDAEFLKDPSKEVTGGFILGDEGFVKWVKEQFLSSQADDKEKPQLKRLRSRVDMKDIVSIVGKSFGSEPEQIFAKGKKKNTARDVAIYLSRILTGKGGNELGLIFGNVTGAAITMRYKAVHDEIKKNRKLKSRINRLTNKINNI
jgi:REP element-mobilizing transposase RayT